MHEAHQIDIRSLDFDAAMYRTYTAGLLTHPNQSNARIQLTKNQVMIWHETLQGAPNIGTLGYLIREA